MLSSSAISSSTSVVSAVSGADDGMVSAGALSSPSVSSVRSSKNEQFFIAYNDTSAWLINKVSFDFDFFFDFTYENSRYTHCGVLCEANEPI